MHINKLKKQLKLKFYPLLAITIEMISIKQIRAARGLLDWSQGDLAKACGISLTAINNIDRGRTTPHIETLGKIRRTLESQGIEFISGDGVRTQEKVFKVVTFEGPEAFPKFLKDILETLKQVGGEAVHILDSEKNFIEDHRDIGFEYYKEFKRNYLREKILICEGEMLKYGPAATSQYRWVSKEFATQVLSSVYGNKYTIYLPNKIVTIENQEIAETYRKRFYASWNKAKIMPHSVPLFDKDLKKKI